VSFFRVWLMGYVNPARMVEALEGKPAPHWGVYGQVGRALLDALLPYLPLWLMGREPSTPSYLTFLSTARYYGALVILAPAVLLVQWLFLSAAVHVILRLSGRESDVDQIMNLTGMAALVVGAGLVAWDWVWIGMGWENAVWLGVSHLLIVIWWSVITVLGFKRVLGVPVWAGIVLNVVWVILGLPLAMVFMRAPV